MHDGPAPVSAPCPPPPPTTLTPAVEVWPAGRSIVRCHASEFHATAFNPGLGRGRFHPLVRSDAAVPTLYGADRVSGALSETLLHNVPVRGPGRRVLGAALHRLALSELVPRRALRLAALRGAGLRRLRVSRAELIESPQRCYAATARWAEALHAVTDVDGLVWTSRQDDTALALVLFGDRVGPAGLEQRRGPMPLAVGEGLARVRALLVAADITLVTA